MKGRIMSAKHQPATPLPLDWWPSYTHAEQWMLSKGFERIAGGWEWQNENFRVYLRRDVSGVRGRAILRELGEE
jgi:hypothetical protein